MSRFPKITETFILYEMLAAEEAGASVEVFPLQREKTQKMHPEAVEFVQRAHFVPLMSSEIIIDNLRLLMTRPVLWLSTLWTIVRANLGCRRFLIGALAVFPKCVTLARKMQAQKIDHIHAHFASHPAAAAWMIHQFSGISYSFVAHGSDLHRDRDMLGEKVRDAAFVVAISAYNRRIILNETGEKYAAKVNVIHCGVNSADFLPQKDQRQNVEDKTLRVLCIGTLHEVKGQTYLIDAVKIVTDRGVSLKLHLVGDGPDQQMLEQQVADLGVSDVVVFEGRRDRHEIIKLLKTADILATPSVPTSDGRREGIPVVLMEGMASGVPVISSRLSGIPELVKHDVNGLLTEPGDSRAIADALLRLAGDAQLRKCLGDEGRATVEDHFSLEAGVRQLLHQIGRIHGGVIPEASCDEHQETTFASAQRTIEEVTK